VFQSEVNIKQTIMLQPKITVENYSVTNKQTTKLKSSDTITSLENWKKTLKMPSINQFRNMRTHNNSNELRKIKMKTKRTAFMPSINNLATFLILAITVYSSTFCMAQLNEQNKDLKPTPLLNPNEQATKFKSKSDDDWRAITSFKSTLSVASVQSIQPTRTLKASTSAAAAATTTSHKMSNLNKSRSYQSRQRKASSQNTHDRRPEAAILNRQTVAIGDEARYNLATRVMSNGVEVIVAGDKTTLPGGHLNTHLRILTTIDAFKMPLTLAPSTLKDHMLMILPTSSSNANNGLSAPIKNTQILSELQMLNNQNQFVTKTCLTTFTYSTTYVENGTTKIESREKVIANTATEERNAYRIRPTATSGITLTQTPHLGTGVFKTTYTYLNTIMDGEQPLVVTSQHTVTNTITAPEDYLSLLQPSEPTATHFETNTYYSTVILTKTLNDSDISKVISTTDVVKQVVITELLPSKSTQVMTSYIAIDADGNESPAEKSDILASPLLSATDVVKTYYVTYTYFNTYLVNGSTIVRTNVSTSSDIVTEKLYIYPTKRVTLPQTTIRHAVPIRIESINNSIGGVDNYNKNNYGHSSNELFNDALKQTINVHATKTLMTTFTYFTTLLQGPQSTDLSTDDFDNEQMTTVVNSHTRVVENVVTESIPTNFLPSSAIQKLKLMFFGDDELKMNDNRYTTVATLLDGNAIEITAVKSSIDSTATHPSNVNVYPSTGSGEESNEEELIEIDNNKNDFENDQQYAETSDLEVSDGGANEIEINPALKTNSTKLKQPTSSVSNLIGSINFNNGLKALRPMIDAVAGLINTNFRLGWNNDSVSSNSEVIHHHHVPTFTPRPHTGNLPPIPDYIENLTSNKTLNSIPKPFANTEPAKGHARNPIYIPVNANKENYDLATTQQLIENLTPKNFNPPEIADHTESINEIKPMIDGSGGIPISPGDVITANSDVIFGRLTGNRPRIPLNPLSADQNIPTFEKINSLSSLSHVTPPPGVLSPDSFSDSHSISSIREETYIGPPPPLPDQAPAVHIKPKPPHLLKSNPQFNKIPIYRNKPPFVPNKTPSRITSALPPHQVIANQIQLNRLRAQKHSQLQPQTQPQLNHAIKEPINLVRQNVIPINHVIHQNAIHMPVNHPPQQLLHAHALHKQQIPIVHQNHPTPHLAPQTNAEMHEYVLNKVAGGSNDIIEIQRIPEVFSTDLPPVHIYHAPQQIVSFTAETIEPTRTAEPNRPHDIQTIHQFPEVVESSTGQPLFVNIQPSQIAKVVIPHGSSSALIFGGVQEMHKAGEYFDDPSPYPNANDQFIAIHSKPTVATIKNNVQVVHTPNDAVGINHSIVSNQKVNVDSHVLSQDVDMHVPPIIFKNQDSNDIPITSGTYSEHGIASGTYSEPITNQHQQVNHHPQANHHLQVSQHFVPPHLLVKPGPISPFSVNIQSINLGMSADDNDSNDSNVAAEVSDDGPDNHSQAPKVHDDVIDQHTDDDFANEHGEVIQESNSVPQLVSSDQSDSVNGIPEFTKSTTQTDHRFKYTQTESNNLWNEYSSTTESAQVSHRPTLSQHLSVPPKGDVKRPVVNSYRLPYGDFVNIHVPQVPPSLVNEMYSANHSEKGPTPNPNAVNRIPNNKHFYNHPTVDERPLKIANIGPPHHNLIPLSNAAAGFPIRVPVFKESFAHRPPHQRPISINQKPFSRHPPIYHNKPISPVINFTQQHPNEPIKPQWHSSKPFDSGHFRPSRFPLTEPIDQTPRPSDAISHFSTHKPFIRLGGQQSETEIKIDNLANRTADQHPPIDLTRGKPFVNVPQRAQTLSNLNIGEEKRPMNESSVRDSLHDGSESHAHHENAEIPYYVSVTETNSDTTNNLPSTANTVFVPFGNKLNDQSSENIYPKTPATEMQPPPTFETKYKPYIHKQIPSKTTPNSEVVGLSPPPLPTPTVKRPDLTNNFGKVIPTHKIYTPAIPFGITAPTHYPETKPSATQKEITLHHQPITEYYDGTSYQKINRNKSTTKEMLLVTEPSPIIVDDSREYVNYSFGTNVNMNKFGENKTNEKVSGSRQPSNGHMPQSLHLNLDTVVAPVTRSISLQTISPTNYVTIQPTATIKPETIYSTQLISEEAKTFTVTTTKTTVVYSQGIPSTISLTLTKTKTSTVVDTVTHTLVKPTRVTYEPSIKPTIFTAPVTMKTIMDSTSSIIPNPSFSIYYSAHDVSSSDDDSSSEKEESFEIDNVHNTRHMIAPTPKVHVETTTKTRPNGTNDSIFVVMTDHKRLGTINIDSDVLHSIAINKSTDADKTHSKPHPNHDETDNDEFFNNLPKRDEDDISNDVSHVLLGGILIATPPRSSDVSRTNNVKQSQPQNDYFDVNINEEIGEHLDHQGAAVVEETRVSEKSHQLECQPDCRAINNEICHQVNEAPRCVCRPGFARMFPDRPCKPTYTYTLHLAVSQLQSQSLKYEDVLRNPNSPKYAHLMQVVHDAIDRMVRQSDLRDIYHGVHVAGFSNVTSNTNKTKIINNSSIPLSGVETEFHLQLSENTKNEEQIMDVFKSYLQKNNFNLGGTNLYSSQSLIDQLRAHDFDECNNSRYHDCSENAYCFNLRGTYTCSCRDGFVDLSENPSYPGRVCSAELMGCNRCNYHGACIEHERVDNFDETETVCECFQWYAGDKCQYNLKVFLVILIALGGILFALLLVCIILTCWRHNKPTSRRRTVVPGIDILPHKTLTVHGSKSGTLQDKRAMIEDTSSETSEDSCQLPYVARKQTSNVTSKSGKRPISKPTSAPPKGMAPPPPPKTNPQNMDMNQSLTVMIPRAKYHSQQASGHNGTLEVPHHMHDRRIVQTGVATATQGPAIMFTTTDSTESTAEAKLLSYLDASPSTSKGFMMQKSNKNHLNDGHYPFHSGEPGALISAGFEVSATVVHDMQTDMNGHNSRNLDASSSASTHKKNTDHLLDSMVDWLQHVPENELIISEARSYGETLVHPQTKTLIDSPHYRSQNTSLYDKPLSTIMMDEANTMAERDLGSTFLLPHTHLYKPDRASDISGFDSL